MQAGFAFEEGGVCSVLADAQAGVGAEAFEGLVDAFFEFEGGEQGGGGLGEFAAELGDLRVTLLEAGKFFFPCGVIRVEMCEVPAVGLGDFLAGGDALDGGFGGSG